jgi:hypothetical protein
MGGVFEMLLFLDDVIADPSLNGRVLCVSTVLAGQHGFKDGDAIVSNMNCQHPRFVPCRIMVRPHVQVAVSPSLQQYLNGDMSRIRLFLPRSLASSSVAVSSAADGGNAAVSGPRVVAYMTLQQNINDLDDADSKDEVIEPVNKPLPDIGSFLSALADPVVVEQQIVKVGDAHWKVVALWDALQFRLPFGAVMPRTRVKSNGAPHLWLAPERAPEGSFAAAMAAVSLASVTPAPDKVLQEKTAPKSKVPQKKRPCKNGPKNRAGQRAKLLRKRQLNCRRKAAARVDREDSQDGSDPDDAAEVDFEEGDNSVVEFVSALSEDDFSDYIDEEDESDDDGEGEGAANWKAVAENAILIAFASIQGQSEVHIPRKRNRRHRNEGFDEGEGSSSQGIRNDCCYFNVRLSCFHAIFMSLFFYHVLSRG